MGQIADLSAFISQAQAQLTRLAGALDATGGAESAGHASASAFLRRSCGITAGHAGEVIATARGLRRLEATEKALGAGLISFDQAQIIARAIAHIDDAQVALAEEILLDNAPGPDPGRLRRLAEEVAYRADPERAEEREKRRWDQALPVVRAHPG